MKPEQQATKRRILGSILRDLRLRQGLNQVELARRLGRPQSYVSNYESAQKRLAL